LSDVILHCIVVTMFACCRENKTGIEQLLLKLLSTSVELHRQCINIKFLQSQTRDFTIFTRNCSIK